ncbi:hypothetical protein HK096_011172, partial [Nowakowskiella sp. JEL0078]
MKSMSIQASRDFLLARESAVNLLQLSQTRTILKLKNALSNIHHEKWPILIEQFLLTPLRQNKVEFDSLVKNFTKIQKAVEECMKSSEIAYEDGKVLNSQRRKEFEKSRKDLIAFRYKVFTLANELYDTTIGVHANCYPKGKGKSKKSNSSLSQIDSINAVQPPIPDIIISNENAESHRVELFPPTYTFEDRNYTPTPFDILETNHEILNIERANKVSSTSNRNQLLLEEPLTTTLPDFVQRKRASSMPPNLKLPPSPPKPDEEQFMQEGRGLARMSVVSTASTVTPSKMRMRHISTSLPSAPMLPLPKLPTITFFELSPMLEIDRLSRTSGPASAPPQLWMNGIPSLSRSRSPVPNFPLPTPP